QVRPGHQRAETRRGHPAHRRRRGVGRDDPQAAGLPAGARRGSLRPRHRRPHAALAAGRALHRPRHRHDGDAVTTSELADKYLMQTGRRLPVTFVRGQGCLVWDEQGKEYLDLVAGIAVNLLGHAHPAVASAVARQAQTLIHTSNLYFTQPQVDLARRLVELSFPSRVFFCSSGAEANEAAIKIARKWGAKNRGGAHEIITTAGSFHGRTLATITAGGQAKYSDPFRPLPDGFVHVAYNDAAAIEAATTDKTVAVLLEPVMGEIGVIPAAPGYLRQVRGWCDQR